MKLSDLSREDLYEKVWTIPGSKLSEEFGISDVAIAKHCKKLNVPRPPRGYWAKIEAGRKLKRPSLPPTAEQVFIQEASKPVGKRLTLPADASSLHPLAAEFYKTVESAGLSYDKKRVHLRERPFPATDISKQVALRAAQAFHAVLQVVEPRGIHFRRSQSSYDGGHFRKGNDYLYLEIEEDLVTKPETGGRRTSLARWQEDKVPCGRLTFRFKTERYGSSKAKSWTENETSALGTLTAEMAKFICDHYVEAQKRREAEAIEREKQRVESERRHQEYLREEASRQRKAAEEKHVQSLETAAQCRRDDLAKAAEWWRLYQSITSFIAECERRWGAEASGEITPERHDWLNWARETANALSPFDSGYPDPTADGGFDPSEIPFGGPYPETREFPRPPTMPEIPAPTVIKQGYEANYQPPPKQQFPFWLKNPCR